MKLQSVPPKPDGLDDRARALWSSFDAEGNVVAERPQLAEKWARAVRWLRSESKCGFALDGEVFKRVEKGKTRLDVRIRARWRGDCIRAGR